MSLTTQSDSTTDSLGAALIPQVSYTGQLQVTDDVGRRIQEILLLNSQASLLSTMLANEKTAKYTIMEIR